MHFFLISLENQTMKYDIPKCQSIFSNRFTGVSGEPFADYKKGKTVKNEFIDASDILLYKKEKKEDIKSFYYKSLLSFSEGIAAFKRNNLTWATIKLYYSMFFGLRCSLLCRNIIFLRAKNYLYYADLRVGGKYMLVSGQNDHAGVINTYCTLFSRTDFMCTNEIDAMNLFDWMDNCRNIVNYKDADFHDPDVSELWENIVEKDRTIGFDKIIDDYRADPYKFCCSENDAILAIPLYRILKVSQEIKNEGIPILNDAQKQWIIAQLGDLASLFNTIF